MKDIKKLSWVNLGKNFDFSKKVLAFLAVVGLISVSCTEDKPKVQTAPKKEFTSIQQNAPKSPSFRWEKPGTWIEKNASSMRVASFAVPGKPDNADASIIVLGGAAGGLSANVNRWRGQAGLAPLQEAEINALAQKDKSGLGEFSWFMIESVDKSKSSILAAVLPYKGKTVFVKVTGHYSVLKENNDQFVALVKSLSEV